MTTPHTPRAFEVVLEHIESGILEGRYRVGDTLPAERALAENLGVSRAAVREAIRALEAQGVLSSHVGAGATGGTKVTRSRSDALSRLLRLHLYLSDAPAAEVVELRIGLERTSVRLVADAAPDVDLTVLRTLVEEMETGEPDAERFNDLDTRFHVTLARLAGNALLADLTAAVRESVRRPILAAEHALAADGDYPAFRRRLAREHRGVYEALAAGDTDAARRLVEEHVRGAYDTLLLPTGLTPRP